MVGKQQKSIKPQRDEKTCERSLGCTCLRRTMLLLCDTVVILQKPFISTKIRESSAGSTRHRLSVLKQKVGKEFNFFLKHQKENKKCFSGARRLMPVSSQYPLALRQSSDFYYKKILRNSVCAGV